MEELESPRKSIETSSFSSWPEKPFQGARFPDAFFSGRVNVLFGCLLFAIGNQVDNRDVGRRNAHREAIQLAAHLQE